MSRVVNKGLIPKREEDSDGAEEDKWTDPKKLQALIDEAVKEGYLHQNGNGFELTRDGIIFVRETKFAKGKLGQIGTGPRQVRDDSREPTIQLRPRNRKLSRTTVYERVRRIA